MSLDNEQPCQRQESQCTACDATVWGSRQGGAQTDRSLQLISQSALLNLRVSGSVRENM